MEFHSEPETYIWLDRGQKSTKIVKMIELKIYIGGGNWSTRRKPLTSHKSLTNFIR